MRIRTLLKVGHIIESELYQDLYLARSPHKHVTSDSRIQYCATGCMHTIQALKYPLLSCIDGELHLIRHPWDQSNCLEYRGTVVLPIHHTGLISRVPVTLSKNFTASC